MKGGDKFYSPMKYSSLIVSLNLWAVNFTCTLQSLYSLLVGKDNEWDEVGYFPSSM